MTLRSPQRPATVLLLSVILAAAVAGAPQAHAEDLSSGWSVAPVEAPLGEKRSCAATKMTGSDRGIGFSKMSSGMELMTVAVEGWTYPLGKKVPETMRIGDAEPLKFDAYGQNNATLAKGHFTTNPALLAAKAVEIVVGGKKLTFDVEGVKEAFHALETCMMPKA